MKWICISYLPNRWILTDNNDNYIRYHSFYFIISLKDYNISDYKGLRVISKNQMNYYFNNPDIFYMENLL